MPDRDTFSMEAQNMTASKTHTQAGIKVKRLFSKAGVHPFDEIEWDVRTASIQNEKGETIATFSIKPNTLADEFRAGGRIPLIIGRALTGKARAALGMADLLDTGLSPKQASAIMARLTRRSRRHVYQEALRLRRHHERG